mgnify:FL=1
MHSLNDSASTMIQWGFIGLFIAAIVSLYFLIRFLSRKAQMVDILDYGGLRQFVKSRWYPAVFQIPALALFGIIAAYLFLGPKEYGQNPGSILIWTFWWAILPFSFILVGRLWCAICPFACISDFVQKHFGRRQIIPFWLGK